MVAIKHNKYAKLFVNIDLDYNNIENINIKTTFTNQEIQTITFCDKNIETDNKIYFDDFVFVNLKYIKVNINNKIIYFPIQQIKNISIEKDLSLIKLTIINDKINDYYKEYNINEYQKMIKLIESKYC